MENWSELIEKTARDYKIRFGSEPSWIVSAPARVNLIGEHTDYNDGFVFPMAIERYTVIAAGPRTDSVDRARVYSSTADQEVELMVDGSTSPSEPVRWESYVQGTIDCCRKKGIVPEPFYALIHSTVPLGGGLSSSASLEVATATLLEAMTGVELNGIEKALLCQKAEHEYAKMPCGIMDQFITALAQRGKAMLLDCRSHETRMYPLDDPNIVVMIANSNVKHALTGSEYPERRRSCFRVAELLNVPFLRDASLEVLEANRELLQKEGEALYRRARHVISEDQRTLDMAAALEQRDYSTVGSLMYAAHDSLRFDYEVSCPEIDLLVDLAHSIGEEGGMIGSRMTGGGFGGCTVSLVDSSRFESIRERLARDYYEQTGIEPMIFTTRAAQGACLVQ